MNYTELSNTPSYFYATAYWLSALLMLRDKEVRFKGWKGAFVSGGFLAFFQLFMYWTRDSKQLLFVLMMLIIVGAFLLYIHTFYEIDWIETVYYCAREFIVAEFMASFCWQLCYHYAIRSGRMIRPVRQVLEMLVIYALLFALWFTARQAMFREKVELVLTWKEAASSVLFALSVYIVSNLSYIDGEWLFSSNLARDIFIIRTLVDLCGVAVMYAQHFQIRETQQRFEKETLRGIMDMQYKTYQLSQESIDIVNQKYHDLKHQIVLLRSEEHSRKSEEYLSQLEQEIRVYEAQNKTGNHVLDAVLTSKSLYCQKQGIELRSIADGKRLDFMSDMEISALFGNMLDNAIESAEKQSDPRKKMIKLYVTAEKQFLRIRIENYCEERIRFRNGMPITTKRDKHLHGFGMKSMQKTVEKYKGSVVAAQEDHWFILKILIPLTGQNDGKGTEGVVSDLSL